MNKKSRPVFLNLMKMKFPPMAIVSILHRVSGVLLFIFIPFALYFLQQSLDSSQSFVQLKVLLSTPFMSFLLWVFLSALAYHLLAGIRHILMDFGWGEGLSCARRSAYLLIVLEVIAIILLGVWLW